MIPSVALMIPAPIKTTSVFGTSDLITLDIGDF
jgi:hypothetical protein